MMKDDSVAGVRGYAAVPFAHLALGNGQELCNFRCIVAIYDHVNFRTALLLCITRRLGSLSHTKEEEVLLTAYNE